MRMLGNTLTTSLTRVTGVAYEIGLGCAPDPLKAGEWYLKAAEHGNAPAMRAVGAAFEHGRLGLAKVR